MAVNRAEMNNQPELPELRHRRMPQALTTTMQSGSMRTAGHDSRSNMKEGSGSPVAMPACTAPPRVKCLYLATTLIGIAATLVPGVGVADDVYLRAGIGFDRPAETRFMDKDCSSVSPAALYGCGTGGDGAPLRSLGDFGTVPALSSGSAIYSRAPRGSKSWSNTGRASPSMAAPISWSPRASSRSQRTSPPCRAYWPFTWTCRN